jgi:alpha-L-fucosidase 2
MTGILTFRSHALSWQDGLFLGNGRSSLIVCGGIAEERLILGHGACWLPLEARRPLPAGLPQRLAEARAALWAGRPVEAQRGWLEACRAAGIRYVGTDSCHPAARVRIALADSGEALGWRRWLDPASGTAGASWTEAGGARWERRAWVDRLADVVIWEQDLPREQEVVVSLDSAGADRETAWIASTYPGLDAAGWAGQVTPITELVHIEQTEAGDTTLLTGSYRHGPGGWRVALRIAGATWQEGVARLSGVRCVRVVAAIAAAVDRLPDANELRARLHRPVDQPAHAAAHRAWFERCRLHLDPAGPAPAAEPVEDLLATAADGPVPGRLWQHLWDLGRGLFIASTDPAAEFPPHLQGIWTGTWRPPWFGCHTNDENVQMMHWQALSGNLGPLLAPLRRLIRRSLPAWRDNARLLTGCRGVLAPLQQGGAEASFQQAEWHGWTGGAGWLARHLWDAWLLDGDPALLRDELVPLLTEVIAFYQDYLVAGDDGRLHALPSVSVENQPCGWPSRWTIDATMEIAIVREVLRHALAAAEAAGRASNECAWREMLATLPGYRVNADGELAEWIHPQHADNHQHRHLSHLYPLFPGDEITADDPGLTAAARRAVTARLQVGLRSQTGWSLVHLAHILARLGDGAGAQGCLERLLRTCVQANLLTVHDDWRGQGLTLGSGGRERGALQLDALYGAASAMQECLVQSGADHLELLPALPPAWTSGAARGLTTRCGVEVELRWGDGRAEALLTARRLAVLRCRLSGGAVQDLRLPAGSRQRLRW